MIDTRSLVKIRYNVKEIVLNLLLIFIIAIVVTYSPTNWIIYSTILFVVMCIVNLKTIRGLVCDFIKIVKSMFHKKKGA